MTDLKAVARDLAPSGALRASINLGNPVLAQGSAQVPRGVTVDIAREIGLRLDVPVELLCFDAARQSFDAMAAGVADICFLAIDPVREAEVAFSRPYLAIEGVYVVREGSPVVSSHDVDREGMQVGVKEGSAYDLFLTRELTNATVVRGTQGVDVFVAEGLEVGAGIRQPVTEWAAATPAMRVVEPAFMQIRQVVGTTKDRSPETVAWLRAFVAELRARGFVAEALARSGHDPSLAC